jgi:ubiquinone/menaquinone biosynthesis C-methylase UbiE
VISPKAEPSGLSGPLLLGAVVGTVAVLAVSASTRTKSVTAPATKKKAEGPKPGLSEDERYTCGPSVKYWKSYSPDNATRRIQALLLRSPQATPYFAAQFFKTLGLSINGLAGLGLGAMIKQRDRGRPDAGFLGAILRDFPAQMQSLVGEVFGCALEDYEAIQAGKFKAPWNMPPQLPPQEVARSAWGSPVVGISEGARFLQESANALDRRRGAAYGKVNTKNWMTSPLFPSYNSEKISSSAYDLSTETLFAGRQDLMQRTALLPLASWSRRYEKGLRVLEVGCGSGKFSTFIRDNYGAAKLTLSDINPLYLKEARAAHQRYNRVKSVSDPGITYVQADAGSLPFDSGSFDVVINMYCFHDLPQEQRERVASEMDRVTAKNGLVILTDSVQRGDRPQMDMGLEQFGRLNKPFYEEYITTDLGEMFEATGLQPYEKHISSVTKTLSWRKVHGSSGTKSSPDDVEPDAETVASNIVSGPTPGFFVLPADEIVAQVDDEESGVMVDDEDSGSTETAAKEGRKKLPRFTRLRRILPGRRKTEVAAQDDATEVAEDDAAEAPVLSTEADGIELTEKDGETPLTVVSALLSEEAAQVDDVASGTAGNREPAADMTEELLVELAADIDGETEPLDVIPVPEENAKLPRFTRLRRLLPGGRKRKTETQEMDLYDSMEPVEFNP